VNTPVGLSQGKPRRASYLAQGIAAHSGCLGALRLLTIGLAASSPRTALHDEGSASRHPGVVLARLSPPGICRRCRDRISGPTLFPVAVNAIVSNDDFAWSAFANKIAFLNPDDLDGSTAVARIVVVQYLSDVQHFNPYAQQRTWRGRLGVLDCHVTGTTIECRPQKIPRRDVVNRKMEPTAVQQLPNEDVFAQKDPFAAVIRCTADAAKADKRTRSKWSGLLRYADERKLNSDPVGPVCQTQVRHQRLRRSVFAWPRPSEAETRWAEVTDGRDQFLFGRVSMPYDRPAGPSQLGSRIDGTAHRRDHQCDLDSRIGSLESPQKNSNCKQ
jgi:hypothetical protein